MSYDLAVWEGERPDDDEAAIDAFEGLYERYIGAKRPPSPRIAGYVTALLERYPDISTEAGFHDSPWASAPLMSEASGPIVYFPMVASRGAETAEWAGRLAGEHGLVCFDPQRDQLLTPWGIPWRYEFTSVYGDRIRNPEPGAMGGILAQLDAEDPWAMLTRGDGQSIRVVWTGPGRYSFGRTGNLAEVTGAFEDFLAGK